MNRFAENGPKSEPHNLEHLLSRYVKELLFLWGFLMLLLLIASQNAMGSATASPTPVMVFAGSGSNLPITRLLAEAFQKRHPGVKIDIPASIGSTGGVRAVADGGITVALISRPLKEEEKGLKLSTLAYARTAVVMGVNRNAPDDGITLTDLVNIYRGRKTRWKDGREIVVLTREPGDSSIELLEREVPCFRDAYRESQEAGRWKTIYNDQEMNRAIVRIPYSLGISDAGAIKTDRLAIKALKVNGVSPSLKNVQKGAYPLVKTLSFAFYRERLPAPAKSFMDFVVSAEGARILRANGYLPVN